MSLGWKRTDNGKCESRSFDSAAKSAAIAQDDSFGGQGRVQANVVGLVRVLLGSGRGGEDVLRVYCGEPEPESLYRSDE